MTMLVGVPGENCGGRGGWTCGGIGGAAGALTDRSGDGRIPAVRSLLAATNPFLCCSGAIETC